MNKSIRNIFLKEMIFCNKLKFFNPYIFSTRRRRPLIFQTINSVKSKSLNLKCRRFTSSGCKDIGIRKSKLVVKTQFLFSL